MDSVFRDYYGHQESKFNGQFGILSRKHVLVRGIIHIGKESNKLEETNVVGVGKDGYEVYDDGSIHLTDREKDFVMTVTPSVSRRFEICRGQLYSIRDRIRDGLALILQPKTISRLRRMFEALGIL